MSMRRTIIRVQKIPFVKPLPAKESLLIRWMMKMPTDGRCFWNRRTRAVQIGFRAQLLIQLKGVPFCSLIRTLLTVMSCQKVGVLWSCTCVGVGRCGLISIPLHVG